MDTSASVLEWLQGRAAGPRASESLPESWPDSSPESWPDSSPEPWPDSFSESSPVEAVRYRRKSLSALLANPVDFVNFHTAMTVLLVNNEVLRDAAGSFTRVWGKLVDYHNAVGLRIHGTLGRPDSEWPNRPTDDWRRPPDSSQSAYLPLQRFLPWHRLFLLQFERELQRIMPGAFIPYWDWTADRSLPSWVTSWRPRLTTPSRTVSVQRSLGDPDDLPTTDQVNAVKRLTDYMTFTVNLEWIHNTPHGWVGGTMGDPRISPADIVFFFHHAQIDRIWRQWQLAHPRVGHPNPSLDLPDGGLPHLSIGGRTLSTVRDVLDVEALEYDYA